MKDKFTFVCCIIITAVISYFVGRNSMSTEHERDYQAACILSDCCHNMVDNIGVEAEEIYYDYIDNLDCYPDVIVTREEIERYGWSY